jgi:plasmid maintenance system antidote protein VapI
MTFSPTADEMRSLRTSIGVSQSGLARMSGVQRWRINAFELGDMDLSDEDLHKLEVAFQSHLDRLHNLPSSLDLIGFGRARRAGSDAVQRQSTGDTAA